MAVNKGDCNRCNLVEVEGRVGGRAHSSWMLFLGECNYILQTIMTINLVCHKNNALTFYNAVLGR
jgi:hypothetical protein